MSNPNNWQSQNAQQPSRWQSGNWGGYAQQPRQQPAQSPSQPPQTTYQQPYQGAYPGGYQQPTYPGSYQQQQQQQPAARAGAWSANPQNAQPAKAKAAGGRTFTAALLFAVVFAVTCLYGFIFSGAANWRSSMYANLMTTFSVAESGSVYSIVGISLAVASGIFLVLGVSRERFSWAAAIACWMWSVICILNLVSLITADGFFESFKYAEAKYLIYMILILASQFVQTVAWLIAGILLLIRGKNIAKAVLAIAALVFSVIEYAYPLIVLGSMPNRFWEILMMIVIAVFGALISRCLAVMLYKPGK